MRVAGRRGRWIFVRALVRLTLLLASTRTIAGAEAAPDADPAPTPAPVSAAAPEERITVRAPSWREDDPAPSSALLGHADLVSRPAAFGDPLRALTGRAGIAAQSDFSSDLRIRGGDAADTAVLLDGLPLPQAYHFSGGAGSTSVLSADLVQEVQVHSGGFSAEYGDALAGVVDLGSRDQRPARLSGEAGLSTLLGHLALRGPAGAGSWLIATRESDLRLYEDRVGGEPIQGVAFRDLFGALRVALPGFGRLDVMVLDGGSGFEQEIGSADRASLRGEVRGARARFEMPFGGRTLLRLLAARGTLASSSSVTGGASEDQRQERDDLRLTLLRSLGEVHQMTGGVALARTQDRIDGALDGGYAIVPAALHGGTATEGMFLEDLWRASSKLSLRCGARADHFSWTGETALSPRLSLALRPVEGLEIRAAAGRFVQFPRPDQVFRATGEPLRRQAADEIILGLERAWPGGSRLVLETYRRKMTDPIGEAINRYVDLPEILTRFDRGRIDGVDLTLERSAAGPWRLRLDYSYMVARQERGGAWVPSNTDLRHSATLLAGRRLGRGWDLSGTLRYQSGLPYTPEGPWSDGVEIGTRPLELNSARLPIYHRLDLRISRSVAAAWGRLGFYVELLNVYGRSNVRNVDLFFDSGTSTYYRKVDGQSPFLPVFGLSAEF